MSALITSVGDADFSGRDFIGETEKSAVRTSVSAKSFLSQKIDGHKSADEEKRNGNEDGRKSCPKFARYQMVGKLWYQRLVLRRGEISNDGRINEHIQRDDERHEN